MDDIKQMAKTVAQCIKGDTKKTKGYDTAATVKRVDGNTVYVSIPGGVPETPVKKTIDAKVGDTVQVHVGNGTAWLTGNRTAPPTDDAEALVAKAVAKVADKTATKAKTTAEQAQKTANGIKQHFWTDDDGAHITEVTQAEYEDDPDNAGGNLLAQASSVSVREGTKDLAVMSKDGFDAKSYDSNDDPVQIAHLGYGDGTTEGGGTSKAPYYTLGTRRETSITRDGTTYQPTVGNYSVAFGYGNIASAYNALVTGQANVSNGGLSFVGGDSCVNNGKNNLVYGESASAGSLCRGTALFGYHTKYSSSYGLVAGKYNADKNNTLFEVGNGTSTSARSNAFEVLEAGGVRSPLETPTPSITASTGSLNGVDCERFGQTVQLVLRVQKSSATAQGANIFAGTLNTTALRPAISATGCGYFGTRNITGTITSSGAIVVRNCGESLPANNTVVLSFTYLVA